MKVSDLALRANEQGVVDAANWVTREQATALGARIVPCDSIVFPKVGAALLGNARGRTFVPLLIDNNMMAVVPSDLDPGFSYWWLRSVDMAHLSEGGTLPFVSDTAVRDLQVPLTPIDQQRRVADFLDDRVARIDQIITARRLQLTLTRDKFRSALEREFWDTSERMPLKHLLANVTSGPRGWGDLVRDEGTPFVRIGNLRPLGVELVGENLVCVDMPTDAEARRASLSKGDVLLSITAAFGEVAIWRGGSGTFSQHVARLRPLRNDDSDWIAWVLQTLTTHDQYKVLAYGGTKVGMGLDQVRNLQVPKRNPECRARLGERMKGEWAGFAGKTEVLTRSVQLLQEYKQSLVTAAVTGEIDVSTAGSGIPS